MTRPTKTSIERSPRGGRPIPPPAPSTLAEPDAPVEWKRGVLGNDEKKKILYEHIAKDVETLSQEMNRSPKLIQEYIDSIYQDNPHADILKPLRETTFYKTLRLEMSVDELNLFESQYISFSKEFQLDDLNAFEKQQLRDYIRAEIREHRYNRELRYCMDEQELIRVELNQLKEKRLLDREVLDQTDRNRMTDIMSQLREISKQVKEWDALVKQTEDFKNATLKALKVTREQRLAKATDVRRNFPGLLRELMDEGFAARERRHVTMVDVAARKSTERYAQPITLKDGSIEQPLLTVETFERWQNDDGEVPAGPEQGGEDADA